jgi:hypothetical protein
MARKVSQLLATALLVSLLAVPPASAAGKPVTASGPSKQELRALRLRGDALNRKYHLGAYAGPSKQELRALRLRGDALNRKYHLGAYATATGSSFRWSDAGIGSAATIGAILVGLAIGLAIRRRTTLHHRTV